MIRRIALTLAASALSLLGAAPAALADTTYAACNGVWVIVDYGSAGGGVSTRCATSFSTGTAALRSAGFTPTLDNGFLTKINAKPSAPDPKTAYWSYWQATRQADGSYSGWKYANTGANSSHPVKGNAEGWHYVSVSGGASPPGATPRKNPAQAAAAPTTAPSSTKSSTAPTTKASSKPSSSKPTAATTTPSSSSADSQTSSASPAPSGAATSPPASSPTEAPSADPPGMDVPAGSPIAVIATTSALAVGAAGAGGWWLWRGRRR